MDSKEFILKLCSTFWVFLFSNFKQWWTDERQDKKMLINPHNLHKPFFSCKSVMIISNCDPKNIFCCKDWPSCVPVIWFIFIYGNIVYIKIDL